MRVPRLFLFLIALVTISGSLSAATEIPFVYANGMIWVKVAVAGQKVPLNFLLDSGASRSVLDLTAARRIGVPLGRSEVVQGVDGQTVAYRVKDLQSEVGGIAVARTPLAVDLTGVSTGLSQRIDGLLGADFFRDRIVQIDYGAGKLRVLARGELREAGCEILPVVNRNGAICVRVGVAGRDGECLRVDTGCSSALRWVVTDSDAKELADKSFALAAKAGRSLNTMVQLGNSRCEGVITAIHARQIFPGESGLLGNGLLDRFTVTIDGQKDRLLLAKK